MRSAVFRPKPKGTKRPHSLKRLTLNNIKQMIEDKYTLYTIAEKYGVSYETVSRIKRGL